MNWRPHNSAHQFLRGVRFYTEGTQMTKRTLQLLLLVSLSSLGAVGQINCSNGAPAANKLVCQIPFSTGIFNGNGSTAQTTGIATVFNSAIATQVSQLPLATSSSGTVVLYRNGVQETIDNLGPILTDRARTVGRHQLFLSFTASQFFFTDIDGINLAKVPFSYKAISSDNSSAIYTSENLNIHFKINQYVSIATFGVTDKLDVSMILPAERVSIGSATGDTTEYLVNIKSNMGSAFPVGPAYAPGIASGIGDITFAAKYNIKTLEHAAFSAGLNVRTPTGDDRNYLGSGAWGTNPYGVFSYYFSRLSPHVRLGYQWNSETELNPNLVRPGSNLALPGGMQYDLGADYAVIKHLTIAADLMGDQYLNAARLTPSTSSLTYDNPVGSSKPTTTVALPSVTSVNSSYWINDISAGLKWEPYKTFILSGNVLFQLNNVGMRARPTPLLGISYQF